jgi:hypothetical protein
MIDTGCDAGWRQADFRDSVEADFSLKFAKC